MFKRLSGSLAAAALLAAVGVGSVYAQEDLSREDGLPSRIGGNTCGSVPRGGVATLTGFLNVRGSVNAGHTPVFTVAVYARGTFVERKKVKNGGAFTFYCVPRENVSLSAEVDSTQIGTFSVGDLAESGFTNRQDLDIQWSETSAQPSQKNGVVGIQSLYKRSNDNEKLFDNALNKLAENNGSSSAAMLEKIVKSDPADFAAWAFLGNIYFNQGHFEDAEKKYDGALTANKDYMPAMIGVGRSALSQKKFARAIEVLSAAYAAAPASADVNHYLGEAYLQDRKGSLAIVHMNKALDIAPMEKAELHLRLGALYNAAGAKDLAAKQFALYLQKRPADPSRAKLEQYIAENSK